MKTHKSKVRVLAFIFAITFGALSYGMTAETDTFPGAPKSYHELEALYEQGQPPTLDDFPEESFFSLPTYLWNSPATAKTDMQITVAFHEPTLGVLKYTVGGSAGEAAPFLQETKSNIRNGKLSPLKVSAAGTELRNLYNSQGCMHQFSYRKITNAVAEFDVVVSQLTIWGNCLYQIAVPYLYKYFILLHAKDPVETRTPSDLYLGNKIVGHLQSGTKLSVVSVNQDWVYVSQPNGPTINGWVQLKNLKAIRN